MLTSSVGLMIINIIIWCLMDSWWVILKWDRLAAFWFHDVRSPNSWHRHILSCNVTCAFAWPNEYIYIYYETHPTVHLQIDHWIYYTRTVMGTPMTLPHQSWAVPLGHLFWGDFLRKTWHYGTMALGIQQHLRCWRWFIRWLSSSLQNKTSWNWL